MVVEGAVESVELAQVVDVATTQRLLAAAAMAWSTLAAMAAELSALQWVYAWRWQPNASVLAFSPQVSACGIQERLSHAVGQPWGEWPKLWQTPLVYLRICCNNESNQEY